jgi:hypothetical protein
MKINRILKYYQFINFILFKHFFKSEQVSTLTHYIIHSDSDISADYIDQLNDHLLRTEDQNDVSLNVDFLNCLFDRVINSDSRVIKVDFD